MQKLVMNIEHLWCMLESWLNLFCVRAIPEVLLNGDLTFMKFINIFLINYAMQHDLWNDSLFERFVEHNSAVTVVSGNIRCTVAIDDEWKCDGRCRIINNNDFVYCLTWKWIYFWKLHFSIKFDVSLIFHSQQWVQHKMWPNMNQYS